MINLDNLTPLTNGGKREVYNHPNDPTQIIKVIIPRRRQKEIDRGFYERLTKPSYTWEYIREILTVYRAARRAPPDLPRLPLIQTSGLVQTTKGLGIAVEKITGPDGELAPTLSHLREAGVFDETYLKHLNDFIRLLFQLRVVACDLHERNIVWDYVTETFVAIDGFGERTIIPIHVWSQTANNYNLNKTLTSKLARRMKLNWDKKTRQLSF